MTGLCDRGLLDPSGHLTEVGRATKDRIESLTDVLAEAPYEGLAPDELDELLVALKPLSQRLKAVGSNSRARRVNLGESTLLPWIAAIS
jgi:hypothetical protein